MTKDSLRVKRYGPRKEKDPIRRTREYKYVGAIEKKYHRNFGVRSDMYVTTLLKKRGLASVNDLIRSRQGQEGRHVLLVRTLTYF